MATWPAAKRNWRRPSAKPRRTRSRQSKSAIELLRRGIELVQQLDPAGVGARDLRECLLIQIAAQQQEFAQLFAKQAADAGR